MVDVHYLVAPGTVSGQHLSVVPWRACWLGESSQLGIVLFRVSQTVDYSAHML